MFKRRNKIQKKIERQQLFGAGLVTLTHPRSILSEQFRTLRTNINFSQIDKQHQTLLVSSSILGEGKSTVSANLALVMGSADKNVLLVDADLRKPTLHRTFKLNNLQGLSTLLARPNLNIHSIIQKNKHVNIHLLPSGPIPPNPAELLASRQMTRLMTELKQHYDLIIYDAPPILAVTDAQILASKVESVIMVARANYVRKEEVRKAQKALESVNANLIGFVLNGVEPEDRKGNYSY